MMRYFLLGCLLGLVLINSGCDSDNVAVKKPLLTYHGIAESAYRASSWASDRTDCSVTLFVVGGRYSQHLTPIVECHFEKNEIPVSLTFIADKVSVEAYKLGESIEPSMFYVFYQPVVLMNVKGTWEPINLPDQRKMKP